MFKKFNKPFKKFQQYHKWTKWNIEKKEITIEEQTEEVILVTMNSNKVNSINHEFIADLNGALDAIDKDFAPHIPVVLTGQGSTFSAGLDMKLVLSLNEKELRENYFTPLNNCLERLYLLNRPTCAAINGHAIGPGLILAFACDFRNVYINEKDEHGMNSPELSLREVQYGLPLISVAFEIARKQIPSPDPLYELLFTGRKFSTNEAFSRQLITNFTEEENELLDSSFELVTRGNPKQSFPAFQLLKKSLKEPGLLQMRESGEHKILDEFFIKQIQDPTVRKNVELGLKK